MTLIKAAPIDALKVAITTGAFFATTGLFPDIPKQDMITFLSVFTGSFAGQSLVNTIAALYENIKQNNNSKSR